MREKFNDFLLCLILILGLALCNIDRFVVKMSFVLGKELISRHFNLEICQPLKFVNLKHVMLNKKNIRFSYFIYILQIIFPPSIELRLSGSPTKITDS